MRSHAYRDLLPDTDGALVNTTYGFVTRPRHEAIGGVDESTVRVRQQVAIGMGTHDCRDAAPQLAVRARTASCGAASRQSCVPMPIATCCRTRTVLSSTPPMAS